MFDKINVSKLVSGHLATLRSARTRGARIGDYLLFFVFPGVVSATLLLLRWDVAPVVGHLMTVVAIFAGLLFSLLILLYDSGARQAASAKKDDLRHRLLMEAHANTAFAILVAIPLLILAPLPVLDPGNRVLLHIVSAIVYYLFGVFMLTLLMILKRVGVLMRTDLRESQEEVTVRRAS